MRAPHVLQACAACVGALLLYAASAGACEPGAKVSCLCRGGWSKMVCADDGSKFGACDCPDGPPVPAAPPAPVVSPAPVAAAPALAAPPLLAPAPATTKGPPAALAPVPEAPSTAAHTVLVAGIVLLSTGYFISLVGGGASTVIAAHENQQVGATCVSRPGMLFVPLAGAAVSTAGFAQYNFVGNYHNTLCSEGTAAVAAAGIFDTVLQLTGAGLITGSLIATSGDDDPAHPAAPAAPAARATVRFVVSPGVAGNPLGLSAGWVWF
jgi:hypothetical protein